MKILYSSAEVRHEIMKSFSTPKTRKVAIVAFVGDGADIYLPNSGNLHVVCWPNPGATNPHQIRHLIQRGVRVSFCDSLHMKLYWAKGKGAVITSANLSTGALGSGGLKEFGVLVSDREINIDKILRSLKLREPSSKELRQLDRRHDSFQVKNGSFSKKGKPATYAEWYNTIARRQWKIGWSDSYGEFSKEAIAIAKRDYDLKPQWFVSAGKNDYRREDWILSFMLRGDSASEFNWVFVDYIARLSKTEKASSTYGEQAVQVAQKSRYPIPPFFIDREFKTAFNRAMKAYGGDERIKNMRSAKPPERFLRLIYLLYSKANRR